MIEGMIVGNLTRNAEQKDYNGTPFIAFTVAVNEKSRDGQKTTQYVDCISYVHMNILQWLTQGSKVLVRGSIKANAYLNKEGVATGSLRIRASVIELLGGGQQQQAPQGAPQQFAQPQQPQQPVYAGPQPAYQQYQQPVQQVQQVQQQAPQPQVTQPNLGDSGDSLPF